jgi:transcriptional regulator with XRE-family HTH domain
MPRYATLRVVEPDSFGAQLRRRRKKIRWSREKLAEACGLSLAGIENIEMRNPKPKRTSVIDIATALERAGAWTVAEALEAAGQPPLADDEQPGDATDTNPYTDPVEREIWALTDLPEAERRAYIELLRQRRSQTG